MAGLISLIDRSVLSKAYFSREHVARHQLDSFNNFLQANLQKVVNEQKIIETDIGSQGDLFPSEARLRNLTYAAPIMLELTLVQGEERQEPVITTIGQLPIMVGSASCNLYGMSETERISHGEDPFDPGGYFKQDHDGIH